VELDFDRREKLENQARMLAIAHYILGGLVMLFSLFPLIYVAMGVMFLVAPPPNTSGGPPVELFGLMFAGIGLFASLFILVIGVMNIIAGLNLSTRKGQTLILVVSVLNLLHQPLGLALGIMTLIYLLQADVKTLFNIAKEERLELDELT